MNRRYKVIISTDNTIVIYATKAVVTTFGTVSFVCETESEYGEVVVAEFDMSKIIGWYKE